MFYIYIIIINSIICRGEHYDFEIKDGEVKIKLFSDIAPNHVKRFKTLADSNQYDGVVFHRVIDGFMAQTGDVEFGNSTNDKYDLAKGWYWRI